MCPEIQADVVTQTRGDDETTLLDVSGLQAGYGNKQVVFGVDLAVRRGEIVGIIGHNGAGKTTTLHACFGSVKPTGGQIRYRGEAITGRSPRLNVRDGITIVRAEQFTFGELSVRENLQLGSMFVRSASEREERLAEVYKLLPILEERASQKAGKFSGGQQRLLSIGMALLARPDLIILDEPSLGIAPGLTATIFDTLKALVRDRDISILIVEQNIPQLLRIVDRVYVLRAGRIIAEESVEQMRARDSYWDLF